MIPSFFRIFRGKFPSPEGWIASAQTGFRRVGRIVALVMAATVIAGPALSQNRTLTVYFEGTDHELHVYRIFGKEPGKTLLLIGGIQGDEPGGFLSADHYADLSLDRGNLIVVPRANFPSIVRNQRSVNEDMNRKFAEDPHQNYETKIVGILKKLIQESDCLLNLHDGSGFYADVWHGPNRNPNRYGQSIIGDCEVHVDSGTGRTIHLGALARKVCTEINRRIKSPDHHFHFNNHRTNAGNSPNREQRKSATYFALYTCGIPAFGVETSKSLPLELKVRHHNLAINAFMDILGIVPETPGLRLTDPVLQYLVISINGRLPVAVQNGQTLHLRTGDSILISHIEANYDRGLSADVSGVGAFNDFRRKVVIRGPTRIVVRKDYTECGRIDIDLSPAGPGQEIGSADPDPAFLLFKVAVNGTPRIIENFATVELIRGDTFRIIDVICGAASSDGLTVNFKGYVGNPRNNTGEDRGYVIATDRDLMKRFSLARDGRCYPVIVSAGERIVGKLRVTLLEPELKYVVLRHGDGPLQCLVAGQALQVDADRPVTLVDIRTNVENLESVRTFLSGGEKGRVRIALSDPFFVPAGSEAGDGTVRLEFFRGEAVLGSVALTQRAPGPVARSGGQKDTPVAATGR